MTRIEQGQHILKMIEAVDVNDTDTLDEIDKEAFEFIDAYYIHKAEEPLWLYNMRSGYSYPDFTCDLQALHEVIPDDWYITKCYMLKDYYVVGLSHDFELNGKLVTNTELSHPLKTMHLAWLHAITQAYIYMEENNNDT